MIFALAGNQNCGKTTLFNALTGSNQHVGNFPGVTVDQKAGVIKGTDHQVVDLPGIYSIRPYTQEEIVTRDFILKSRPDAIINIVDATNIERNLYLTLQLLTLQVPTVIALNMMDELVGNGGSVDVQKMSEAIGVPVVPISAAKNQGITELVDTLIDTASRIFLHQNTAFHQCADKRTCINARVFRETFVLGGNQGMNQIRRQLIIPHKDTVFLTERPSAQHFAVIGYNLGCKLQVRVLQLLDRGNITNPSLGYRGKNEGYS